MNANNPSEFFTGITLDMWRKAVSPVQTEAEAAFVRELLAAPAGGRILDVPCGNGRHCLALARHGYAMTGVDIAGEFVDEARRASEAAALPIDWRRAEMRDLPWTAEFDGAYCLGNSFGYFDHAGMMEFLAAVSRALKPGARFVFDSGAVAESILPNLLPSFWMRLDDILMLIANAYHPREGRLETTFTFVRNGREDVRVHSQWVFTLAEIQRMLEAAGLRLLEAYGSLSKTPYQFKDVFLYAVAEKIE